MISLIHLVATFALVVSPVLAQTSSSCNPLDKTGCDPDPALGKTVTIDFTQGESSYFSASGSGSIDYTSSGLELTINEEGDAPTLTSNVYIFWGKVTMKCLAASGTGIVSSLVLESDDLDEIDYEWLGGDTTQVQSNYFGKGNTTSYDRGAYHGIDSPQTVEHTYTIEYTSSQVTWSFDGTTQRTLAYADAVDGKNFPQTPMMIKIGIWAGGDSSNAAGTIEWAGGETDFSDAPFTMTVSSITIEDYSTGACEYKYSDKTGDYTSIDIIKSGCDSSSSSSASSGSSTSTESSTATGTSSETATSTADDSSEDATSTSMPTYTTGTASVTGTISASATGTAAPINMLGNTFYSFNNATTNSTHPVGNSSNSSTVASGASPSATSAVQDTSAAAAFMSQPWTVVAITALLGAVVGL